MLKWLVQRNVMYGLIWIAGNLLIQYTIQKKKFVCKKTVQENVLKKAGVADRMLITLATDKAPAVLVAVPDEISQKQFVHSIRDLLITHCDGDEEKITKTLLEISK